MQEKITTKLSNFQSMLHKGFAYVITLRDHIVGPQGKGGKELLLYSGVSSLYYVAGLPPALFYQL